MCGIFGFVGKRERAESIDLEVALKSLHHRGPDDRGTYFGLSKADPDVACAFAHTRLSIIDLSAAGHQPMTTENGRYTIVYNGEIYNFRDLRAELEQLGCRFDSNCDTEVVLRAYVRWGKDSLHRLRGMFAFAIWDDELGTLFMARDRLGIKPLYYMQMASGLAFSSEVRTLLNCGIAERHLSRDALNSYLAFGSAAEPFTMIKNVLALPPGSYGETGAGQARITAYWSLDAFDQPVSREAYLETTIHDAINSELEADVPVGVFLSGGIDSSAIVSIASASNANPLHTFTVTFDEAEYNEGMYAAEVASLYGCDHHQVHLSAASVLPEFDNMFAAVDQPSADGVNTYFVSKAARASGLAVVLSGLGGDEVFAGYRSFRSLNAICAVARAVSPLSALIPEASSVLLRNRSIRMRKIASVLRTRGDPVSVYAIMREMFSPEQIGALKPPSFTDTAVMSEGPSTTSRINGDVINAYSRLELRNYLRNTLLRDADAMSMAHSLEVRVPLLDHLVVESALSVSGPKKLSRKTNKPLLLRAAPSLPASVVSRRKMGFTLPLEVWLRGPLEGLVSATLESDVCNGGEILRAETVRDLYGEFRKGSKSVSYSRLWCLVALLEWCRRNDIVCA